MGFACLTLICFAAISLISCQEQGQQKAVGFVCPEEFGIYANPHNCRGFIVCFAYIPYTNVCPSHLFYEDTTKTCQEETNELRCGHEGIDVHIPEEPKVEEVKGCVPEACHFPNCYCSEDGKKIPRNFEPHETPQMVILTFNGPLTRLNGERFKDFFRWSNPNGCPIRATFFVPHQYNNYYFVEKLYSEGHEISFQSITNRHPEHFWSTASTDEWVEEVVGMREILYQFTDVSREDLIGMRAPYMRPGGNNMMAMMQEYGVEYDSSLTAPVSDVPVWPYTLDYHIPHPCVVPRCPTSSFPGIWEFPVNLLASVDGTESCAFVDQCRFPNETFSMSDFLIHNFERHYTTNRAPFIVNVHVNWLMEHRKVSAINYFISRVLGNHPDVWFVTMKQAMEWMRRPTPQHLMNTFERWQCPVLHRKEACGEPTTCALKATYGDHLSVQYMDVCGTCPARYPWLHNILGAKDEYQAKDIAPRAG